MLVEIVDGDERGMLVETDLYFGVGDTFKHPKLRQRHRIIEFDGKGRAYAEPESWLGSFGKLPNPKAARLEG